MKVPEHHALLLTFIRFIRTYPGLVKEPCVKIGFKNKMQN